MTRLPAISALLVLAACEHGQTPPQECGNRIVEDFEECDDGNTRTGDGCDQCVLENVCGNGLLDQSEQCDDGNTFPGDGCSAACTKEQPPASLFVSWQFQDLGGQITGCPTGFDLMFVHSVGEIAGEFLDAFPCDAGGGVSSSSLTPDLYTVTLEVTDNNGGVFATSLPQLVDLRVGSGTVSTTIFNDAGFFGVTWVLRGANSNDILNCAQANVTEIQVSSLPGSGAPIVDSLDCTAGSGFTQPLAPGAYTVSLVAETANSQIVGSSTPLSGQMVEAPNGLTSLMIEIPIAGM